MNSTESSDASNSSWISSIVEAIAQHDPPTLSFPAAHALLTFAALVACISIYTSVLALYDVATRWVRMRLAWMAAFTWLAAAASVGILAHELRLPGGTPYDDVEVSLLLAVFVAGITALCVGLALWFWLVLSLRAEQRPRNTQVAWTRQLRAEASELAANLASDIWRVRGKTDRVCARITTQTAEAGWTVILKTPTRRGLMYLVNENLMQYYDLHIPETSMEAYAKAIATNGADDPIDRFDVAANRSAPTLKNAMRDTAEP